MGEREQGSLEISDVYLIHDGSLELEPLSERAPQRRLTGLHWNQRDTPPTEARVLLYLPAWQICELAAVAVERQWEIGVLPHPEAKQASRALGVKGDLADAFDRFLQTEAIEGDVLTCNDQVVFSSVVIGEVLDLRPYDLDRPPTRWSTFLGTVRAARALRLRSYRLTKGPSASG